MKKNERFKLLNETVKLFNQQFDCDVKRIPYSKVKFMELLQNREFHTLLTLRPYADGFYCEYENDYSMNCDATLDNNDVIYHMCEIVYSNREAIAKESRFYVQESSMSDVILLVLHDLKGQRCDYAMISSEFELPEYRG